jgi:16S rRNA (uracil1498-N3)-methyltransferase
MRIPRIYTVQSLEIGGSIVLDDGAARHLTSALRMTAGQQIMLFNGLGGEYSAELTLAKKGKASAVVTGFSAIDRESPLQLHLAIGISRGERMDWIIQKATELGVNQITPLFSERCEVKLSGERLEKRLSHLQQVAISACEQSQRNRVPNINPAVSLQEWLSLCDAKLKLVLHHRTDQRLGTMANGQDSIGLLVGPEGGLSQAEIDRALDNNFQALALGPRVLRTETAPLAAISILQSLWGDMG